MSRSSWLPSPPGAGWRIGARTERTTPELSVRRGSTADAAAAADLLIRARRASEQSSIPPPIHTDEETCEWVRSRVAGGVVELWLASRMPDGALAGMMLLDGEWIDQLMVDPALTGRGIGARLVGVAKRRRPGGLRLWTFVSNTGAQRFYVREGFVEVLRTDGARNEERAPDIQYRWSGV